MVCGFEYVCVVQRKLHTNRQQTTSMSGWLPEVYAFPRLRFCVRVLSFLGEVLLHNMGVRSRDCLVFLALCMPRATIFSLPARIFRTRMAADMSSPIIGFFFFAPYITSFDRSRYSYYIFLKY
ncbi:hypothetical protein CC78DRAFT_61638 [Lojkania enalia]|uniref:Uncharacterized protein n=1 Tax=Lojkania enalia TaxID=147567 RepID=A0A9P4KIZ8_9PLEO|nr:hypothetical protein CC78DRAFT_61638 [Didymosphaeria enalia]